MIIRRSRSVRRLLAAATVAALPLLAPATSAAGPAQEGPSRAGDTEPSDALADTSADTDAVLRASATDVAASLGDRNAEVQAQLASATAARTAAADADAALAAADAAVAATEQQIADLTTRTDQVVVDSFINPPSESAMETLAAPTLAESTVRQAILDRQTDANVEVLDELEAAQEQLEAQKAAQEDAVDEADARAEEAAQARDDLVSALSDETLFVLGVQDRLAANLAEASALEAIDPAAAEALRAREAELATALGSVVTQRQAQAAAQAAFERAMADAAARAAAQTSSRSSTSGGRTLGPASGSLRDVACPGGGSITVDSSVASSLASMMDAAAADGNNLCGGGYRDPSAQIALRRANCGSSDYAIYEMPSSSCSPPTAPPGTSNHEQGTAVDFTCNGGGTLSRSSSCFTWLKSNAAGYGFYNLPSEPWHWSVDGT